MAGINHEQRAARAWPVLTRCAKVGESITYARLARAIGIHHRPLRYVLGRVQDYCLRTDKPPLTVLVVRGGDKKPGSGFLGWDQELDKPRAEVVAFPWESFPNPFEFAEGGATYQELVKRLVRIPESAGEVYKLVKDRGVRQMIFRDALLEAYDSACAFCGLSFREALDAAHIYDWALCEEKDRVNPRNGVLLCSNHHRMFDSGNLSVTTDLRIEYVDPERSDGPYSAMDDEMSVAIHGKRMRLPRRQNLWPDPTLIAAMRELEDDS